MKFLEACDGTAVAAADRLALWQLHISRPTTRRTEAERVEKIMESYRHWRLYVLSRQGDERAAEDFSQFWRRYVGGFLRGRGSPEEVEELTSLFFERVYQRVRPNFDWRCPFVAYLRCVLVSVWSDLVERHGRLRDRECDLEKDHSGVPDTAPLPDTQALARERQSAFRRSLQRLASRDRLVLLGRFLDGKSAREMALELGVTVDIINTTVHRGRKRLKRLFGEEMA